MLRYILLMFVFLNFNFIWAGDAMAGNNKVKGRLEGRVALVTGAAQGIGKEIARVLAREGAQVVIADINDGEGQLVIQEIDSGSCYIHLDVSSERDWQLAMERILGMYARLDILVNNAGLNGAVDPENGTLENWRKIQAVDLEGVFLGCKYAIRMMKNTTEHGSIINISSIAWTRGIPGGIAYSASKAAVTNLTQSVAVYCGQQGYNIRCNWISPGFIPTPMLVGVKRDAEQEARFHEYIRSIPLGKMGTPEDIGNGVLFLASDESKYITGTELRIDGGVTAWTGIPWTREKIGE
jgi:NAD(P)-dependent dehydrogenase (short-subunit alcohol dehydrogenase family)